MVEIVAVYEEVALAQLALSPTNPRKTRDPEALKELISSIKAQGVIVPLLVRPIDQAEPGSFEVVCGSRRFEAARKAGLKTVPVIVRDLSDSETMELQVIENLQREDVHPMDEATGYQLLMERCAYDIQQVAAKVGRAPAYIYQRLQLCNLIAPARKAFLKGQLGTAQALLLARLTEADQDAVLAGVMEPWAMRDGVASLSEVRRRINALMCPMSDAIWDMDDRTLVPDVPACVDCNRRTQKEPMLWPDVETDSCSDGRCFAAKTRAAIQRTVDDLAEKRGRAPVLVSLNSQGSIRNDPKLKGSKLLPTEAWQEVRRGEKHCPATAEAVIADGPHWKQERIGRVVKVCTDRKCKIHHPSVGSGYQPSAQERARKEREKLNQQIGFATLDAIGAQLNVPLERAAFDLIADAVITRMLYDGQKAACKHFAITPEKKNTSRIDYAQALTAWLAAQPQDQAFRSLVMCALLPKVAGFYECSTLKTEAAALGIDVKPIVADITAAHKAKAAKRDAAANRKTEKAARSAPAPVRSSTRDCANCNSRQDEGGDCGHPCDDDDGPACVECGCTEDDACLIDVLDDEAGGTCKWVPDDQLPEGCAGPLCTACLETVRARAKKPARKGRK